MKGIAGTAAYAAFAVALLATVGSLAMSEAYGLVPCMLCWYQRIFMYPLVVVIGVGIVRRDAKWPITALPLAVMGAAVAFYHSLLQWQILPENTAPCVANVSCATAEINWFGFITIPFMSFLAFVTISALAVVYLKGVTNDQRG